jgi:hypothetical protein
MGTSHTITAAQISVRAISNRRPVHCNVWLCLFHPREPAIKVGSGNLILRINVNGLAVVVLREVELTEALIRIGHAYNCNRQFRFKAMRVLSFCQRVLIRLAMVKIVAHVEVRPWVGRIKDYCIL